MEIKTKHKIGDIVWVNYEGRIKSWVIRGIDIKVRNLVQITYELKPQHSSYLFTYKETDVYKSMEELEKAMGI